jgi:hypothetical protein
VHQKTLKTATTVQKVFDGSQNADLCYTSKTWKKYDLNHAAGSARPITH